MEMMALTSDTEFEEGKAALAQFIGDQEAAKPSWFSRLIRRDNEWLIRVQSPVTDLRSRLIVDTFGPGWYGAPWLCDAQYLAVRTLEVPLAEGVELLQSDRSPEIELTRRAELTRQYEEKVRQAKRDAAEREERQVEMRARETALDLEFKTAEWWELPPLAQCLRLLALAVADGGDLESELRKLASQTGKSFPAPRRIWWDAK